MKSIRKLIALAAIAALASVALGQSVQSSTDPSSQQILALQVTMSFADRVTIPYALMVVFAKAHVPAGLVTISSCGEEVAHQLNPSGTSLQAALDSIISAEPSNRWQIADGVVNFLPAQNEPALLNVRIAHFELENVKSPQYAIDKLLSLREVQRALVELKLSQVPTQVGLTDLKRSGSEADDPSLGFNVRCENVTLREALNAMVRAHGYAVWAYTERRCKGRDEFRIESVVR